MEKYKKYGGEMQHDTPKFNNPTITDTKDSEEKENPKNSKT
jgi:hypothetical protein